MMRARTALILAPWALACFVAGAEYERHQRHERWMDAANCASRAIEAGSADDAADCFKSRGLTPPWDEAKP